MADLVLFNVTEGRHLKTLKTHRNFGTWTDMIPGDFSMGKNQRCFGLIYSFTMPTQEVQPFIDAVVKATWKKFAPLAVAAGAQGSRYCLGTLAAAL